MSTEPKPECGGRIHEAVDCPLVSTPASLPASDSPVLDLESIRGSRILMASSTTRELVTTEGAQPKPLYKGHIDPDCEVYRGVGAYCTCQTQAEKDERAREETEIERERDEDKRIETARRQSREQLEGALRQVVERWRGMAVQQDGNTTCVNHAFYVCADELSEIIKEPPR